MSVRSWIIDGYSEEAGEGRIIELVPGWPPNTVLHNIRGPHETLQEICSDHAEIGNLRALHKDYRAKLVQLRADVYDAVDTLEALIEWEVYMGGFENPAWDRARGVVARINGQRFP